jgi:hypothetical protein
VERTGLRSGVADGRTVFEQRRISLRCVVVDGHAVYSLSQGCEGIPCCNPKWFCPGRSPHVVFSVENKGSRTIPVARDVLCARAVAVVVNTALQVNASGAGVDSSARSDEDCVDRLFGELEQGVLCTDVEPCDGQFACMDCGDMYTGPREVRFSVAKLSRHTCRLI